MRRPVDLGGISEEREVETQVALDHLFRPQSVALVGASMTGNPTAAAVLDNLRDFGFCGAIYPVNPKYAQVSGLPCYPSVAALPEVPDTVVVTIPASGVEAVLADCDAAGVASASIMTAGYSSSRRWRTRILGPECVGVVNLVDSYFPRASSNRPRAENARTGPIALVTRSGAMANTVFNRAQSHGVGVSYVVNTGRELDLTLWDVVDYLLDDPAVRVVMTVVEGLGDVRRLCQAAEKAVLLHKPILLLELGKSAAGGRAARSHSGAITGSGSVHSAAFRELNIVEVEDWDQLWMYAGLMGAWGVAPIASSDRRVGVLAVSGGEGIMIADRLGARGIDLEEPAETFVELVGRDYPEIDPHNPLDPTTRVLSDISRWRQLADAWCATAAYTDTLFAAPIYARDIAERRLVPLLDAVADRQGDARVVVSISEATGVTERSHELVVGSRVPFVGSSLDAVQAIAAHIAYCDSLADGAESFIGNLRPPDVTGRTVDAMRLPGGLGKREVFCDEAFALVAAAGLSVGGHVVVATPEDAPGMMGGLRPPYTVKANVNSLVHKSAQGLVVRGVRGSIEIVRAGAHVLQQAAEHRLVTHGVIIMEEVAADWELLVAGQWSDEFGPLLVVGAGGRAVELTKDVAIGFAPVKTERAVSRLLRQTRMGSALLSLAGGTVAARVVEFLGMFSVWYARESQNLLVAELNPVRIDGAGNCVLVDARLASRRSSAVTPDGVDLSRSSSLSPDARRARASPISGNPQFSRGRKRLAARGRAA